MQITTTSSCIKNTFGGVKYMLQLKQWLPVLFFVLLFSTPLKAVDHTGENLLSVIGMNPSAKEFKPIKEFWLLDKNLENEYGGIKFSINPVSGKIESIVIAGDGFQSNGKKFLKCSSPLPYNLLLRDDTATLRTKLGYGEKVMGRSAMRFYVATITIEVSYTNIKDGKISSIKFYNGEKTVPVKEVALETTNSNVVKAKFDNKRKQLEAKVFTTPDVAIDKTATGISPFKKALLDVFRAYRESNFFSIKNGLRSSDNFWKYQYTYTTKLKIPGEKFNMLYSFPFANSPLDFVSVIKEADGYDASFLSTYKDLEKKLMSDFPDTEGWVASCIPNKESKLLSDLEFTNDRYGSIVLDYSKNPNGKHILYLRFLLYSN